MGGRGDHRAGRARTGVSVGEGPVSVDAGAQALVPGWEALPSDPGEPARQPFLGFACLFSSSSAGTSAALCTPRVQAAESAASRPSSD